MAYARARLWTGITGVGAVVLFSALALSQKWAYSYLPQTSQFAQELSVVVILALAYAVAIFPLDLVGGYLLPRKHGFSERSFLSFAIAWHRGVIVQTTLFVVSAMAILEAAQTFGRVGAIICFAGLMLLLLTFQGCLTRLVGRMNRRKEETSHPTELIESADRAFMGGIVGLPGQEKVLIPSHWEETIGAEGVKVQVNRRQTIIAKGWRTQGLLLAFLWNLLGFSFATVMPGSSPDFLAGLVTTFLWLNLWTFLGLLLLPKLSRRGTMAGDQEAIRGGVLPELLAHNIREIDRFQENEPDRSPALESVFHPMPSVERRVAAFSQNSVKTWAPWNVARVALFLSWAGMGMLARTVHCNSGKPEVWVLLPCD